MVLSQATGGSGRPSEPGNTLPDRATAAPGQRERGGGVGTREVTCRHRAAVVVNIRRASAWKGRVVALFGAR